MIDWCYNDDWCCMSVLTAITRRCQGPTTKLHNTEFDGQISNLNLTVENFKSQISNCNLTVEIFNSQIPDCKLTVKFVGGDFQI